MEFSRHEYWSGLPFPSPEDLPDPGIELWSPALKADSLPFELQGSPYRILAIYKAFLKHFRAFHQILGIQMNFTEKSLPTGLPIALIRSMGSPCNAGAHEMPKLDSKTARVANLILSLHDTLL